MGQPINLRQLGADLHARLLAGTSLTVTSEIAEVFLPVLIRSLKSEFRNLSDPHLIDSAAADALIGYFDTPTRFEPQRAGLFTYLRWRARSRLLNLLGKEKVLTAAEKVVEVEAAAAVYEMTGHAVADLEEALAQREADAATLHKLRAIIPDPLDLEFVKLMLEGVRETPRYAALLGITALSIEEQTHLIKRHKDRLKKTIQRKYRREEK